MWLRGMMSHVTLLVLVAVCFFHDCVVVPALYTAGRDMDVLG